MAHAETTERGVNSALQCDDNHDHRPAHDHGTEGEHEHEQGWLEWARVGFVALILLLDWLRFVPRVNGIDILALRRCNKCGCRPLVEVETKYTRVE